MSNNNLPGENSGFWKSPALKGLDEKCPAHFRGRIPVRIRMLKNVHSAFFGGNGPGLFAECGKVFEAWTNRYGAVAAVFPDGQMLGVKPDEFEVVEWYDPASGTVVKDDREVIVYLKQNNIALKDAIEIILGMATTFPTIDILKRLSDATDTLLHRHDYDGHGWEVIQYSMEAANARIEEIKKVMENLNHNMDFSNYEVAAAKESYDQWKRKEEDMHDDANLC